MILDSIVKNSVVDEIIIVVLLIATVEAVAQNTIKQSHPESVNLLFGLFAYILVGYLLHYAYHKYPLSKINVMWSALSIVLAAFFGYILYDEPLSGKFMLAVVFALLAIYLSYDS